jgi:hypothetical protein
VDWHLLLIGIFLPLFPLSLGINILLARLPSAWAKATVLLVWPQIGVFLVAEHIGDLPDWIKFWGLATAGLYAFRMLAMREVNLWIGFLATSSWALLWTPAFKGLSLPELEVLALGFGLPLAIMALLSGEIAKRFGAAYIGLYGGLAVAMPRLTGVLVVSLFAAIATPVFPAFFAMLHTLVISQPLPAVWLVTIWGTWSWGAARLLQGLIVGPAELPYPKDLGVGMTWVFSLLLAGLAIVGLTYTGRLA